MSDQTVYERALRDLAEYERRADELRAFVKMYQELAGSPPSSGQAGSGRTHGVPAPGGDQNRIAGIPEDVMIATAVALIKEAGKPLDRKALAPKIFGIDDASMVSDRDLANLGSRLSRSGKLVNFAKQGKPGYWPKDEPYEPVGYRPGEAGEGDSPAPSEARTDTATSEPEENLFGHGESQAKGNGAVVPYGVY